MRDDKPNLIADLTFQFALATIQFTEKLEQNRKYNLANQLFRSGTSIGANIREAQNAESKNDFVHKIKIAAKEAEESFYWLSLCKDSENYPDTTILLQELTIIMRVISKIVATSKAKS